MRTIILIIGFFLTTTSFANEGGVTYNPHLDLKQITLPKDFDESELLKNDSLFEGPVTDFSNYFLLKKRSDVDRIIGAEPVINVINKMPKTDLNLRLIAALKLDLVNTSNSCSVAGNAVQDEFKQGGLCSGGKCGFFNKISPKMISVMKKFDDSCRDILLPGDRRLNKTVALFLEGKFFCMGYMRDDVLITARHCFYHKGYVIEIVKNKSLEMTRDDYSQIIKAPVEITYAYLSDISNKKTLRMLIPDYTGFMGFEDVIAISISESNDTSFIPPKIAATSNMIVVNRFLVPEQSDLHNAVREYKKPTCRVIASGKSCILHTCPTLPSISGAPLYQTDDDGNNQIIGVHVGAFGENYYEVCADVNESFESGFKGKRATSINVAIPVNEETKIQKVRASQI